MTTVFDLLVQYGLRPKNCKPGTTHRLRCPKCPPKVDEDSFSLKIDDDGQGATGHCHRGSCGHTVGVRIMPEKANGGAYKPAKQHAVPKPHPTSQTVTSEAVYRWFSSRNISADTVDAFGVYSLPRHKFPSGTEGEAIVFPYRFKGELVNRKYRGVQDKRLMMQEPNAAPTLFNVDSVEEPDVIWWVEGEPDVLAMYECGYPQTVSLKDGAPAKLKPEIDLEDKRFLALSTHAELLGQVKKIVLAGDMDEPGTVLRDELARRLGRQRCWVVTWPHDCKDANETLLKHGKEAVRDAVEAAQQFPIEGVQQVSGDRLYAYLKMPAPPVLTTGVSTTDAVMNLPGEGRLIVVTGFPNSGKTTWTMNVMLHLMRRHDRKFLVFSPEMQPFDEFAVQCAEILVGAPARRNKDRPMVQPMTAEQTRKAGDWLSNRMRFLSLDAEDKAPDLDWILERTRDCVLRFGTTDLLIDPWNELESSRGKETETEFIGRGLQRCKAFALRHGCNVWIIAHPQKMKPAKPGDPLPPPGPYDINGSAHWANKADLGFTIHTPEDITDVIMWKSRFKRWGRKGETAKIELDVDTGRYHAPSLPGSQADYERKKDWLE